MKKIFAYFLAAALLLSATACGGKSEAAKSADEQIAAIGEVTLDSEPQISAAEEAVAALAEQDQQQLEHLDTLTDARAAYEALLLDAAAEDASSSLVWAASSSGSRLTLRVKVEGVSSSLSSSVYSTVTVTSGSSRP